MWQTSGIIYNLISFEGCQKVMLSRGVMSLIFDLASSNIISVRHVCSACLHIIPNSIPDMDDPALLDLVLCLLEADGEKLAELSEPSYEALPYNQPTLLLRSPYKASLTNFKPNWMTLSCVVDKVFTAAQVVVPPGNFMSMVIKPLGIAAISNEIHTKMNPLDYDHFSKISEDRTISRGGQLSNTIDADERDKTGSRSASKHPPSNIRSSFLDVVSSLDKNESSNSRTSPKGNMGEKITSLNTLVGDVQLYEELSSKFYNSIDPRPPDLAISPKQASFLKDFTSIRRKSAVGFRLKVGSDGHPIIRPIMSEEVCFVYITNHSSSYEKCVI